jgi:hypothetical protein
MKTMNSILKQTLLGLTFICISLINVGAEDNSKSLLPSSESIVQTLTNEVKSAVSLDEARIKIRESAMVVVELLINSDGKPEINNKSANNSELEDYVSEKLSNISTVFPEEYYGKSVIYRFRLV